MENKRILVIGAAGYIGKDLVRTLSEKGYDITLMLRKNPKNTNLSNYNYFIADLLDKQTFSDKIKEFDIIINLASVVKAKNKSRYKENLLTMKNLIQSIEKSNKKPNLIHISTQNVNLKNKGPYATSKKQAEDILTKSKLGYTIIRPNYVYGIDKNNNFYKLAKTIKRYNLAPIIGTGENKIQPILKQDLIDIVVNNIKTPKKNKIIEASGNQTISINNIISLISNYLKINPKKIHINTKVLTIFKNFISFDIQGFTEDRISKNPIKHTEKITFEENLKKIINLLQ